MSGRIFPSLPRDADTCTGRVWHMYRTRLTRGSFLTTLATWLLWQNIELIVQEKWVWVENEIFQFMDKSVEDRQKHSWVKVFISLGDRTSNWWSRKGQFEWRMQFFNLWINPWKYLEVHWVKLFMDKWTFFKWNTVEWRSAISTELQTSMDKSVLISCSTDRIFCWFKVVMCHMQQSHVRRRLHTILTIRREPGDLCVFSDRKRSRSAAQDDPKKSGPQNMGSAEVVGWSVVWKC